MISYIFLKAFTKYKGGCNAQKKELGVFYFVHFNRLKL
jgi:hypothetical protein